jgi:hypothetical protein
MLKGCCEKRTSLGGVRFELKRVRVAYAVALLGRVALAPYNGFMYFLPLASMKSRRFS